MRIPFLVAVALVGWGCGAEDAGGPVIGRAWVMKVPAAYMVIDQRGDIRYIFRHGDTPELIAAGVAQLLRVERE